MATLLYIFPHPDDESFGPAPALAKQTRDGHDVHLLTLTRGEATSQRNRLGLTKAEMAETRHEEMRSVAEVLGLSSLNVLEYPDGELAELNPMILEEEVAGRIHDLSPDVAVTYPVHGISGHPDHLVSHAVVKRVVCALWRDGAAYPQRLAFFTLQPADEDRPQHLRHSPTELIDCVIPFDNQDLDTAKEALDCYETYRPVIEQHQPLRSVKDGVPFEFFGERHEPARTSLVDSLEESGEQPSAPSLPE